MQERERLRARFRGALVGTGVGDAVGAPFEGAWFIPEKDIDRIRGKPGALRYTDDAHMTIGFAESLVARRGFDGEHLAQTFARNFAREPWRGYGPGPPRIFQMIEQGVPWDEAGGRMFGGEGSYGNGAAMRVAPAALAGFGKREHTTSIAQESSIITHAHPLGIQGALLQAHSVAFLLEQQGAGSLHADEYLSHLESFATLPAYRKQLAAVRYLLSNRADPKTATSRLGNGIAAVEAVPAAIYAFLQSPENFADVITFAIRMGGDTDTIAAMAGANAGAFLGEEAIPDIWLTAAEGVDALRDLADGLLVLTDS